MKFRFKRRQRFLSVRKASSEKQEFSCCGWMASARKQENGAAQSDSGMPLGCPAQPYPRRAESGQTSSWMEPERRGRWTRRSEAGVRDRWPQIQTAVQKCTLTRPSVKGVWFRAWRCFKTDEPMLAVHVNGGCAPARIPVRGSNNCRLRTGSAMQADFDRAHASSPGDATAHGATGARHAQLIRRPCRRLVAHSV